MPPAWDVTAPTRELRTDERGAVDRVVPVVYEELKVLAARYLRKEGPEHTLQATDLVHEAYLRLIDQRQVRWRDRAHFLAVAATVIRRVLVDQARRTRAAKRRGRGTRQPFDTALLACAEDPLELIALDEAMDRLARVERRKCRVVALRFFGGLSIRDVAEMLSVSTATVERDWRFARAWLHHELTA